MHTHARTHARTHTHTHMLQQIMTANLTLWHAASGRTLTFTFSLISHSSSVAAIHTYSWKLARHQITVSSADQSEWIQDENSVGIITVAALILIKMTADTFVVYSGSKSIWTLKYMNAIALDNIIFLGKIAQAHFSNKTFKLMCF